MRTGQVEKQWVLGQLAANFSHQLLQSGLCIGLGLGLSVCFGHDLCFGHGLYRGHDLLILVLSLVCIFFDNLPTVICQLHDQT